MDYEDLGRRIRNYRKERKWTQDVLAKKIGVCTSFVGHVERGSRKASLETIIELCRVLEVSPNDLLGGSLGMVLQDVPEDLPELVREQVALVLQYAGKLAQKTPPLE